MADHGHGGGHDDHGAHAKSSGSGKAGGFGGNPEFSPTAGLVLLVLGMIWFGGHVLFGIDLFQLLIGIMFGVGELQITYG
jgi:hypothetical protein